MSNQRDAAPNTYGKDDWGDDGHRIYHALTDHPENLTSHRLANILSTLIEHLIKKEILTEAELKLMIYQCRG